MSTIPCELIGRSHRALTGVSARELEIWRSTPDDMEERENRSRIAASSHEPPHRHTHRHKRCMVTGTSPKQNCICGTSKRFLHVWNHAHLSQQQRAQQPPCPGTALSGPGPQACTTTGTSTILSKWTSPPCSTPSKHVKTPLIQRRNRQHTAQTPSKHVTDALDENEGLHYAQEARRRRLGINDSTTHVGQQLRNLHSFLPTTPDDACQ